MIGCRACGNKNLEPVLDLGRVPEARRFPLRETPEQPGESNHRLCMLLCPACGLAQLGGDTAPRGADAATLRHHVGRAVRTVAAAGLLRGDTVIEFGNPHDHRAGDTGWIPPLLERNFRVARAGEPASVVVDSFGLEHEPDQGSAIRERAAALAPGGVLFLEFHTLSAIVARRHWDAVRYGTFAYYAVTTLRHVLDDAGLYLWNAWPFGPYDEVILVAAQNDPRTDPEPFLRRLLAAEREKGITMARTLRVLQTAADHQAVALHTWLELMSARGRRVFAYGATSLTVTLFTRAHIDSTLVTAVADPSPARIGRRIPGTDVPIVSPEYMLAATPDHVLIMSSEQLPVLRARYPELGARWILPPRTIDDVHRGNQRIQ